MKRLITRELASWQKKVNRKPLILRGARQVGKTWVVQNFGKQYFEGRTHVIDLERHPEWHRVFEQNLEPLRIISEFEILLNTRISPGKDLVFFDEIQSCPRAIMSLRYFFEVSPELHVIAAGSLLEFATKDLSFPVGRVKLMNLYPMSFVEFLLARGKKRAAEIVQSPPEKQSDSVHAMLLDELRQYLFVGGMPECVREYVRTGKLREVFEIQSELVATLRQDFSKYTPYTDKRCLDAVFTTIARKVGSQIKYARLAEDFSNPTIRKAFDLLCQAQMIRKVPAASPAGLPFGASASARKFKALMLDVGIVQQLCGMQASTEFAQNDLLSIYCGALAEQFVGQEFLTGGQELYYWSREAKSSTAEVDYLIAVDGEVIPVEIKSGAAGRLTSLHLLLRSYPGCPFGYVFSIAPYDELPEQKLKFLPLYYAYKIASS